MATNGSLNDTAVVYAGQSGQFCIDNEAQSIRVVLQSQAHWEQSNFQFSENVLEKRAPPIVSDLEFAIESSLALDRSQPVSKSRKCSKRSRGIRDPAAGHSPAEDRWDGSSVKTLAYSARRNRGAIGRSGSWSSDAAKDCDGTNNCPPAW